MTTQSPSQKPSTVLYAEYALWALTAWTCLLGIYQTWTAIPDVEKTIAEQLQGAITVAPSTLMEWTVPVYLVLAAASAWVIFKIGEGKNWARASLLVGFALDAIWTALPPYNGIMSYLIDVPDLGLQIYALYLLYTPPGRGWFD